MSFYENLEKLCTERGTSPHSLMKRMGLSTYNLTLWRRGGAPKLSTVSRIAEELDVKPSDLLQTEEDEKQAEEVARAALFGSGTVVTDEQWDEVKKFAEFIKNRDSGKK